MRASAYRQVSIWIAVISLLLALTACTSTRVRTATDANGGAVHVRGNVVLIDLDIELSEVTSGGLQEPRREWTQTARELYPQAVRQMLSARGILLLPDWHPADGLPASDHIRQLLLLYQAVASSILIHSQPATELATKHGRLDWTLGPGAQALQQATGADYGLFTTIRDSYTSQGRATMRVIGALLLGGDIGGGGQVGLAMLVDLRSGQIVWFNLLQAETGDLRNAEGARMTAAKLLRGLPL